MRSDGVNKEAENKKPSNPKAEGLMKQAEGLIVIVDVIEQWATIPKSHRCLRFRHYLTMNLFRKFFCGIIIRKTFAIHMYLPGHKPLKK